MAVGQYSNARKSLMGTTILPNEGPDTEKLHTDRHV